jgi:hypothetical protein
MPTPTGLPKVGEVWELEVKVPGRESKPIRVVVLERGRGDYWSLRVYDPRKNERVLWVDPAYWLQMRWLKYIGPAGPNTKKKLGLL